MLKIFKQWATEIAALKQANAELTKRVEKLEEMVFALKSNVTEEKKANLVAAKKKWLNGYPDETAGKKQ